MEISWRNREKCPPSALWLQIPMPGECRFLQPMVVLLGWENVDLSHISPISIGCLKMLAFCPRISMAIDINGQIGYQYSWNDAHSKPKTWIRRLGKIEGHGFSNMGRKDRRKIQKTHENWYGPVTTSMDVGRTGRSHQLHKRQHGWSKFLGRK